MAIFDITLGDWSGDGHSGTETRYLQVSDGVTRQELIDNWQRNTKLLGFSPTDFAADYEDFFIPKAKYDALLVAGFTYTPRSTLEDPMEYWEEKDAYGINVNSLFAITVFYFTNGLPDGTTWSEYKLGFERLLGWGGATNGEFVGYGVTGH